MDSAWEARSCWSSRLQRRSNSQSKLGRKSRLETALATFPKKRPTERSCSGFQSRSNVEASYDSDECSVHHTLAYTTCSSENNDSIATIAVCKYHRPERKYESILYTYHYNKINNPTSTNAQDTCSYQDPGLGLSWLVSARKKRRN